MTDPTKCVNCKTNDRHPGEVVCRDCMDKIAPWQQLKPPAASAERK